MRRRMASGQSSFASATAQGTVPVDGWRGFVGF
jgi:hypothetical protein